MFSTFQIIGIIFFIVAAIAFVAMMILFRPGRIIKHHKLNK